jgi:hypothetical protein
MVQTCSYCHSKPRGGLCSVYWAWFDLEHERVAYKVKYCPTDAHRELGELFVAWNTHIEADDGGNCLTCGLALDEDANIIYARMYLPGLPEREMAADLCSSCHAQLSAQVIEHGEKLKNRTEFAPAHASEAWEKIGFVVVTDH